MPYNRMRMHSHPIFDSPADLMICTQTREPLMDSNFQSCHSLFHAHRIPVGDVDVFMRTYKRLLFK